MNNCLKGTYYNSNTKKCINCPSGTFSDVNGATKCKQCAFGTYQDLAGKSSCNIPTEGPPEPLDIK